MLHKAVFSCDDRQLVFQSKLSDLGPNTSKWSCLEHVDCTNVFFSYSLEGVFDVLGTLDRYWSNTEGLCRLIGSMQQCDVIRKLPAPQHRYPRQTRHNLSQQFQSLAAHLGSEKGYSGNIAARASEAFN